ncbi:FecR domain-containing protein [Asticcacaulis sp. SL142]|uniref:FecR family protein n=1 Tax=Asticcacaulis sp. SL142 TaxID=2995155 RepID=UPI00226C7D21|nr:FecR domain-containing protein [Asticcacaulis sp. SL142]WAC49172.1 FecR domain-containing protein [Asticcacaulis sp. SL142]
MVRTVIPLRPAGTDPQAEAFVDAVTRAEAGETPAVGPDTADVEAVWDALGQLEASDFDVSDVVVNKPAFGSRRYVLGGAALAASLVLGVGLMWNQRPVTYQTDVGEQKTIQLPDGSKVTLNTDTRLSARVTDKHREVTLKSGEAFFTVAHRPDNAPFDVVSGPARIRVTGTKFNVYRKAETTEVDLIEGGVRVGAKNTDANVVLRPGQAVRVDSQGRTGPVTAARATRILDWQQRRLSFESAPLAEAVDEMNRYSRVKLTVTTPALQALKIDGVFDAGDTRGFARALHELHGVSVKENEHEIWLHSARTTDR